MCANLLEEVHALGHGLAPKLRVITNHQRRVLVVLRAVEHKKLGEEVGVEEVALGGDFGREVLYTGRGGVGLGLKVGGWVRGCEVAGCRLEASSWRLAFRG